MTAEQLKKLRGYYHMLLGQQKLLEQEAEHHSNLEDATVRFLTEELTRIQTDFPGLLPYFNAHSFLSHGSYPEDWYKIAGIRSYLAAAIGRLIVEIDVPDTLPVTQTREFSFVGNPELRKVLERDYSEIQRAFVAGCWKSVIILCGSAIEAILLDVAQRDAARAKAASKAPKQSGVTRWDLADLIPVCVELKLVSLGVEKLSHSLRDYRNLVHPGNEIRNKLTFDAEEARIAVEVLNIVHRDLSK